MPSNSHWRGNAYTVLLVAVYKGCKRWVRLDAHGTTGPVFFVYSVGLTVYYTVSLQFGYTGLMAMCQHRLYMHWIIFNGTLAQCAPLTKKEHTALVNSTLAGLGMYGHRAGLKSEVCLSIHIPTY
jgi:hypothetical protein